MNKTQHPRFQSWDQSIQDEIGPMPVISIPENAGFAGTDKEDKVILVALNKSAQTGRTVGITNRTLDGNHSRLEVTRIVPFDHYERSEELRNLFLDTVGPRTKDSTCRPNPRMSLLMEYSFPTLYNATTQAWTLAAQSIVEATDWADRALQLAPDHRQYGLIIGCSMDLTQMKQPNANYRPFQEAHIRGIFAARLVLLGQARRTAQPQLPFQQPDDTTLDDVIQRSVQATPVPDNFVAPWDELADLRD